MMMTTVSAPGVSLQQQQRAVAAPRRSLRVCSQQQQQGVAAPERKAVDLKVLAAGFAAAAVLAFSAAPAEAGVIPYDTQTKKVFQGAPPAAPAAQAPKAAKASSSGGGPSLPEFGFNPRGLVLPLSVVALAGGSFALTTLDPEFAGMFQKTIIKDSFTTGAGYEVVLKSDGGPPTKAGVQGRAGTRKIAAKPATKKGTKKGAPPPPKGGIGGTISGLFGKK